MVPDNSNPEPGPGEDSPPSSPGDSGADPTAPGGPNDPRPHSFPWHVSRVTDRFDAILPFALVPLLTSLLQVANVRRALEPDSGFSINLEFAFPSPLLDLWTFADPPAPSADSRAGGGSTPGSDPFADPHAPAGTGGSGGADLTVDTPLQGVGIPLESVGVATGVWIVLALLLYAVLAAVLAAIYVGGLDRRLRGEPAAIPACARDYAPRFFLYNLAVFGAVLLLVPFALVSPVVILFAIPVAVVLSYLFYAAPFLFVVADAPFLEAFRRSYGFATDAGPYLGFALWHVGVAVASSVALSLLVGAGGAGFLLALVLAVPLSLVLTAATVSFVRELVEAQAEPGSRRA